MRVNIALSKLDNMLNVLLVVQILTTIKTIGWSVFILTTSGSSGTPFGGVIFRALLQGIVTVYLINKMKDELSTLMAWFIFIGCLAVGFASLGSLVSFDPPAFFFNYGLFEIVLVICAVIFMVRYYNYMSAVSREKKEELNKEID